MPLTRAAPPLPTNTNRLTIGEYFATSLSDTVPREGCAPSSLFTGMHGTRPTAHSIAPPSPYAPLGFTKWLAQGAASGLIARSSFPGIHTPPPSFEGGARLLCGYCSSGFIAETGSASASSGGAGRVALRLPYAAPRYVGTVVTSGKFPLFTTNRVSVRLDTSWDAATSETQRATQIECPRQRRHQVVQCITNLARALPVFPALLLLLLPLSLCFSPRRLGETDSLCVRHSEKGGPSMS
ncbi:hypothetical protein E2C01_068508 [Portunus trituberculatus]|uniref:Uncharacterized protein n=1 Tax=Portunus trituberculatus TaxID=210409 RepID=A0A5B7HZM0_PORTR|nr:hypothetical protein [Portunus trituberculatus]